MKITFVTLLTVMALWFVPFATVVATAAEGGAGHEYDGITIEDNRATGSTTSLPIAITIDPTKKINVYSSRLFGYNDSWVTTNHGLRITRIPTPAGSTNLPVKESYLRALASIPLTMDRMSGTASSYLIWKDAIGSVDQRQVQHIVWSKFKVLYGPAEWVSNIRRLHPSAEFVWVLNIARDTPENARDLAEFFTGGPDTAWGKKRVACGMKEPMMPAIWELGNEMDWGKEAVDVDEYIKRCRQWIEAVRSVVPDAVFAAQAASSPWKPSKAKTWMNWHRKVLASLAPDIRYLTFHPYYRGMAPKALMPYIQTMTADIARCSNPGIKLYLSEHGIWPGSGGVKTKNWRDSWYQGRTLNSCLSTGEWILLMLQNPAIGAMSYHCLDGGAAWGLIWQDKSRDRYYTTGPADMFKLFAGVPYGSDVVFTHMTGSGTDWQQKDSSFTSAAVIADEGKSLYLLLNNRMADTSRDMSVHLVGSQEYTLAEKTILTAPNLDSINTLDDHPIQLSRTVCNEDKPFSGMSVPPRCLMLLKLKKRD